MYIKFSIDEVYKYEYYLFSVSSINNKVLKINLQKAYAFHAQCNREKERNVLY